MRLSAYTGLHFACTFAARGTHDSVACDRGLPYPPGAMGWGGSRHGIDGRAELTLRSMLRGVRPIALCSFGAFYALACTQTLEGAETSAFECIDGNDDDGDLLIDCSDPDCWSHAACRVVTPDGGLPDLETPVIPPDETGVIENPQMTTPDVPALDSGVPPVNDGPDSVEDSGSPDVVAPMCSSDCPLDACIDGVCIAAPGALGTFSVLSVSANVPRGPDPAGCFDAGCIEELVPFAPHCPCLPDLQVVVLIGDSKQGTTPLQPDTELYDWTDPPFELVLHENDEIVLTAQDNDGPARPQEIFSCSVTITAELVAGGAIGCTQEFEVGAEIFADSSITLEIAPLATDSSTSQP